MSEVKWTEEQQQAIFEKSSNILVAAAAGSGKTAVLVERIINKIINDKVDIDKLLVVTFTNAAASEMRERVLNAIYKKLENDSENLDLQRQITLLNKASICTIDSFCLEIVRNNFYELENISPNFRIADTTEIDLLKQDILEEIFEKKYEEKNENFEKLINTYTSYQDDTPLKELILKIYTYIQSSPFPKDWLDEKIEMLNLKESLNLDFSDTIWGKELLKELEEELIDDIVTLEDVQKSLSYDEELEKFAQTIENDIKELKSLRINLDSWDKAFEISKSITFIDWPRKKIESEIKVQAKKIRDDIKEKFKKKVNKILVSNSQEANQDIYDMYILLSKLKEIIIEFEKEFSKRKREKNIVDFNDIEHFALEILLKKDENGKIVPSEVANRYRDKFEEIAIDEYQDSNLVQEYILTSVSKGNNIFMVGDVKQSIYKFRQAMPELFLNKYHKYKGKNEKTNDDDLKIQLFKNFRSRSNVLDFTNKIFQNIMSSSLGDIDYNEQEYLNLGANYENINQDYRTEINVLDLNQEEKIEILDDDEIEDEKSQEEPEERIEDIELEARFVANRVKELIDKKFQVFDKKINSYRDITYKDIVVLLRSTKTSAPIFEQELLNLEIPVFSDASQEYLDSIEIQTIISLLKIIDNPIQDIPLVTVLRSNIGNFTDNDLMEIRLADKYDNFYSCMQKAKMDVKKELREKIENFFENLKKWRKEQEYLGLDEFIWKLYTDTGYYNYVGLMPNGELRQANLKMLFERAKNYESASFKGLYNFITFIEKLKLGTGDMSSAKIIGENDNVVRIMSIHKSKGLEFPVVILSGTGKQFNLMDLNNNILLHQEIGIGVKYIDYEKQIKYDTLTKIAIKNKILTETLSEEMRILYVALTRAKEKLIITGISKNYDKDIENIEKQLNRYPKINDKINYILVKKYKKYLDWILLVCNYEKDNIDKLVNLNRYTKKEALDKFSNIEDIDIDVIKELNKKVDFDKKQTEKIKEILEYKYKYELLTTIPTKTSVTKLKEMKNTNSNKKIFSEEKQIVKDKEQFNKPKFLNKDKEKVITPAQKGTLVHLCMQNLDIKVDYKLEDINTLISCLVNKEIITKIEAENINPYKILEFTKSDIWKEIKRAKEVYREKPFYISLPVEEVLKNQLGDETQDFDESILVQGIIDLYYINENDEVVLVDYKTDYIEKENEKELVSKYYKQLELYCRALEDALNKKVSKKYIYSVYLGKSIEIC